MFVLGNLTYHMGMWPTNSLLHVYRVVDRICDSLHDSIRRRSLVKEFRLEELPQLSAKFDKLLTLLLVLITNVVVIS